MSSLITRLAYGRIDRRRLLATYLVGLAVGLAIAAAVLALVDVPHLPLVHH